MVAVVPVGADLAVGCLRAWFVLLPLAVPGLPIRGDVAADVDFLAFFVVGDFVAEDVVRAPSPPVPIRRRLRQKDCEKTCVL